MSFVNLSLLTLGGLFVALPLILHLAMRQKPQHQILPTLRFVKQRQSTNRRRLRFRQALLLLLRCLLIGLLALTLARPSVASAQASNWLVIGGIGTVWLLAAVLLAAAWSNRRGQLLVTLLGAILVLLTGGLGWAAWSLHRSDLPSILGDRKAPVAAVLLFDTSPHMFYRFENRTRLEQAQQVGDELIRQFPTESQVAVVDASRNTGSFAVDLGAALVAVKSLEVSYVPPGWDRLIQNGIDLLTSRERDRKELYLFTDLSRATWTSVIQGDTLRQLAEHPEIAVHVIDVGVNNPSNDAITSLTLAQTTVTPGSTIQFRVQVERTGQLKDAQSRDLQLVLEQDNYKPILINGELTPPTTDIRGRHTVFAKPADSQRSDTARQDVASFSLASLPLGTHHGYVTLSGTDNLHLDDRRYFTLHVRPPHSVLIVTGEAAESFHVTEALAPREFRDTGRAKFVFDSIKPPQLADRPLDSYAVVGILDPSPLAAESWQLLKRYAERGGGIALFLGRNARSAADFNSEAAVELLPAAIERQFRNDDGMTLAPRDFSHPLLAPLRDISSAIPWNGLPVFRHWTTDTLRDASRVIMPYNNGNAALLERGVGRGRVLMMTTPVSDVDDASRLAWNLLPQGDPAWPYLILLDRIFQYLAQSEETSLEYTVGQTAQLPVDLQPGERIQIFTPRGSSLDLTAANDRVEVPFTDAPGIYRLAQDLDANLPHGFSVNLPTNATELSRLTQEELTAALGENRFRVARTMDEIERDVDAARIGQEFYPFLLTLLAIVMAIEYLVSNRFYPAATGGERAA